MEVFFLKEFLSSSLDVILLVMSGAILYHTKKLSDLTKQTNSLFVEIEILKAKRED